MWFYCFEVKAIQSKKEAKSIKNIQKSILFCDVLKTSDIMQKIKVPLNVKTEVCLNGDTTNFSLHTNKKALDLSTILFAVVTLEKSESQERNNHHFSKYWGHFCFLFHSWWSSVQNSRKKIDVQDI